MRSQIKRFFLLAFLTLAAIYIENYVFFSDCSVGGIRDSVWIDDGDKSSGCLPPQLRYVLLFLVPILWIASVVLILKKSQAKK